MMHTHGISYEGDVLDLAVNANIITRQGAWFRYGDKQLGKAGKRPANT